MSVELDPTGHRVEGGGTETASPSDSDEMALARGSAAEVSSLETLAADLGPGSYEGPVGPLDRTKAAVTEPRGADDTILAAGRQDAKSTGLVETLDASRGRGASGLAREDGRRIGRLKILRTLGFGGMGVVYAAYDPELDREVAVKVLRGNNSEAAQLRLQREAQALARLASPHVVAVYDVGTHGGQVWISMELIEGRTLDAWIAEERPGWREVLALVKQAARGIAAAHAEGILHRDIKPGNIMVGDDGRVRVMDFGLARRGGASEHGAALTVEAPASAFSVALTGAGAVLGTPAYMAPEQFSGLFADERTDEFSLAVTLWEALYAQRPFAGETFAALSYAVIEGIRAPPPTESKVPGWLHRLLEKALDVDRNKRFESVRVMLEAIEQREQRTRTRAIIIGLALVAIAFAVLGALALRERAAAIEAEAAMRAERDRANELLVAAKGITRELLVEVLPQYEHLAGTAEVQSEVHERLRSVLTTLRADASEDPELVHLEVLQRNRRGDLAMTHGRLDEARVQYEHGLGLAERSVAERPDDPRAKVDLSTSLAKVGRVASQEGDLSTARRYHERSLEVVEAAIAADPSDLQAQSGLLDALGWLGDDELYGGDIDRAREHFERGLTVAEGIALASPGDFEGRRDLANALDSLGNAEARLGHLGPAREYYERALELAELLVADDPSNTWAQRDLSRFLGQLGGVAERSADLEAARGYHARALTVSERLAEADPSSLLAQRDLLVASLSLGHIERTRGDVSAARSLYLRSLKLSEVLAEREPDSVDAQRDLSIALESLAEIELAAGEVDVARRRITRSLGLMETVAASDPTNTQAQRDLAVSMSRLGKIEENEGDFLAARRLYERLVQVLTRLAEDDPSDAQAQLDLAVAFSIVADLEVSAEAWSAAKRYYTRSVAMYEAYCAADPSDAGVRDSLFGVLRALAGVEHEEGTPAAAQLHYERALEVHAGLLELAPEDAEVTFDRVQIHLSLLEIARERDDPQARREHAKAAKALLDGMVLRGQVRGVQERGAARRQVRRELAALGR